MEAIAMGVRYTCDCGNIQWFEVWADEVDSDSDGLSVQFWNDECYRCRKKYSLSDMNRDAISVLDAYQRQMDNEPNDKQYTQAIQKDSRQPYLGKEAVLKGPSVDRFANPSKPS